MDIVQTVIEFNVRWHVKRLFYRCFDGDYYLAQVESKNVDGMRPARHFLEEGWQHGLDPCSWFSTSDYLARYPDIAAAQCNPFLHFLEHGFKEGRITLGTPPKLRSARLLQLRNYWRKKRRQRNLFSYDSWIKTIEPKLWSDFNTVSSQIKIRPKISICMATYNTRRQFLEEALQSVLAQTYDNWELCIADDCSSDKTVHQVLKKYAARHSKIKIVYRNENGHIAKAMNTAMDSATGDYVVFMDHDDLLAPQALFEIVAVLNAKPEIDFIYSDEDIMDEGGKRLVPHFKSGWNPELLRCHNYITHLCAIRRELVIELGRFRSEYDGAQDYDLMLRIERSVPAERIHRIPLILYHWRAHQGSTAAAAANKTYTQDAGKRALQQWANDCGMHASVESSGRDNFYRLNYCLDTEPSVAIIIPTRDALELLQACVDSVLQKTQYDNYHIYIVDNQSVEEATHSWFAKIGAHEKVTVLGYNRPYNFAELHNEIVQQINAVASPDLLCLLNNDTEVITPDWLAEMAALASQNANGCVGAKLLYPDATVQHAGVILGLGGYAAHSHRGIASQSPGYFNRACLRQNLSAITAACLVVRNSIFSEVGGMDEKFEVAYNDVDFCLKVDAAGYRNIYTPYAQLVHHESKTRGEDSDSPEKSRRFNLEKDRLYAKWKDIIRDDPYYNPNLTRSKEDFSIRQSYEFL